MALPRQWMRGGRGDRGGLGVGTAARLELASSIQYGIGDRADMRMNPLEIAQHVEMQRCGFQAFGAAFAQPVEMPLGRCQFGVAERGFLAKQLVGLADFARHEYAES